MFLKAKFAEAIRTLLSVEDCTQEEFEETMKELSESYQTSWENNEEKWSRDTQRKRLARAKALGGLLSFLFIPSEFDTTAKEIKQ